MIGAQTVIGPITNSLLLVPDGLSIILADEANWGAVEEELPGLTDAVVGLLKEHPSIASAFVPKAGALLKLPKEGKAGGMSAGNLIPIAQALERIPRARFIEAADRLAVSRQMLFSSTPQAVALCQAVLKESESNRELPGKKWALEWNCLLERIGAEDWKGLYDYIRDNLDVYHPLIPRLVRCLEQNHDISLEQAERVLETIYYFGLVMTIKIIADVSGESHLVECLPMNPGMGLCGPKEVAFCLNCRIVESNVGPLLRILSTHSDPWMRWYILRIIMFLPLNHKEDSPHFLEVVEEGLKDSFVLNALLAWSNWERVVGKAEEAKQILLKASDFNPPLIEGSPEFGISKYVYASRFEQRAIMGMLNFNTVSFDRTQALSIEQFRPIHSLADYHPDPKRRRPITAGKYQKIRQIVDEEGLNRDAFFRRFLSFAEHENEEGIWIRVLELPHSSSSLADPRILVQGHHRVAALLLAAGDGVIPKEWLDEIPVKVYRYDGSMPEILVRRIITLGVGLTWPDLFPPGILTNLGR